MFFLEVETPSFTFRAFAESEAGARKALRLAWAEHVTQTGAEPTYVNAAEDGNVYEVQPGECYRDDQLLIANGMVVR